MFDLVYECGARIDIVNRLGLNPLTLAAKLAKKEIFFHILKVQREIYWQIGETSIVLTRLVYDSTRPSRLT